MSQALYRKWRPHLWDEVIGQEHVVHTLQNAIRSGRVGHAYLFSGPRGTGKTTSARLLAKAVNCLAQDPAQRPCDQCAHCQAVNDGRFLDLIEIDAASNTSVDDVRQLRDTINFSPAQGQYKVYIIDEVHMLSTAAFNALLKTLEEPPPHAIFILATTEVHKIPATVLSRCQRHEFRRIPVQLIAGYLRQMCQQEGIAVSEDALVLIARQSTGAMRDAISLLDQLASTGEQITLATAQAVLGTATSQSVVELVEAVLNRQADAGLGCIHQALDGGTDPRQLARQVVDYLRSVLLIKMGSPDQVDATSEMRQQMTAQANRFEAAELLECIRLFNTAASEVRGGWQPSLLLELAVAESVAPRRAAAPAAAALPAAVPAAQAIPAAAVQAPPPAAAIPKPEPREPQVLLQTRSAPAHTSRPEPRAAPPEQGAPPARPAAGAEPPQPRPPEAAGTSAARVDMAAIQQNWGRIINAGKSLRVNLGGLLNSCTLVAIKDGALVIGFTTELLKEKMEAGDNLRMARQAILKVTGQDVVVMCTVTGNKSGPSGSDLGVESDGIVGTALNMGGQIVQKSKTD